MAKKPPPHLLLCALLLRVVLNLDAEKSLHPVKQQPAVPLCVLTKWSKNTQGVVVSIFLCGRDKQIERPGSIFLSCPPGIPPSILNRIYYFSWSNTLLSAALSWLIFLLDLVVFRLSRLVLSDFSPTSSSHHSHIWLTLLRLLITVTGSHSRRAATSRKLMTEVCFSEALCIITLWNENVWWCARARVCEKVFTPI